MSDRTGIFVLLDALALLSARRHQADCQVRPGYTDGAGGQQSIRNGIDLRGLTAQVEIRGTLPYEEVPAWIRSGRIGLVPLLPLPKFMKNISTKTFEYWACGIPVIASNLAPIPSFSYEMDTTGYSSNLAVLRALARAIRLLLAAPAQGEAMGRNGQQQVYESWNNSSQTTGLLHFYTQLGKG